MAEDLAYSSRSVDPSTFRNKNFVRDKLTLVDNFPSFSVVELNIFGSCNRSCSFCPVSDPTVYKKKNEGIGLDLYTKIMNDLSEIHYQGKIVYCGFSEPMLHRGIYDLISISKKTLPQARVEMISNGDLLKPHNLKKLFDAGMDTVSLSLYDGPHQFEHFKKMMMELDLNDSQLILRRRYKQDGNWGMIISNRTGIINSNQYRDEYEEKIEELPLKRKCFYPFYQIFVDYNGDVLLCSHDWRKQVIAGNLKTDHIWKIWTDPKMQEVRKNLAQANRCHSPCNKCDVKGDVMGKENFDSWFKLFGV